MAVIVRYQPEDSSTSYPTLQQAQLADILSTHADTYLESYRLQKIVEALDKYFVITPRLAEDIVEEKEEVKEPE